MRACPDDLAVLSYVELQAHLATCASCARLIGELTRSSSSSP